MEMSNEICYEKTDTKSEKRSSLLDTETIDFKNKSKNTCMVMVELLICFSK